MLFFIKKHQILVLVSNVSCVNVVMVKCATPTINVHILTSTATSIHYQVVMSDGRSLSNRGGISICSMTVLVERHIS